MESGPFEENKYNPEFDIISGPDTGRKYRNKAEISSTGQDDELNIQIQNLLESWIRLYLLTNPEIQNLTIEQINSDIDTRKEIYEHCQEVWKTSLPTNIISLMSQSQSNSFSFDFHMEKAFESVGISWEGVVN